MRAGSRVTSVGMEHQTHEANGGGLHHRKSHSKPAHALRHTLQIWWTWETEDVFRRVREGDKHAMKNFAAKLTGQLTDLTAQVSGAACAFRPTDGITSGSSSRLGPVGAACASVWLALLC